MDYQTEKAYIGNPDQLFPMKEYRFCGGRRDGVRAIDLDNGGGLQLTLLPDRCLDFYRICYRGEGVNYITPAGVVAPAHYQPDNWLGSFAAGFLTTCGLQNIGNPSSDEGKSYGMHGAIGNTPAEALSITDSLRDGAPERTVTACMREGCLFGGNLTLTRQVTIRYREDVIRFTDTLTNEGYTASPYLMLYHFNIGYPLLQESSVLELKSQRVRGRTPEAQAAVDDWQKIFPPVAGIGELCYYHQLERDPEGRSRAAVHNGRTRLEIDFDGKALPQFIQWKLFGKGEYVMGLEPCTSTIEGRAAARVDGTLRFIEPGEEIRHSFVIRLSALG